MALSGMNFGLHYYAIQQKSLRGYWHNLEWRFFLKIMLCLILFTLLILWIDNQGVNALNLIKSSAFTSVAMLTTTGLQYDAFAHWPLSLPLILMLLALIGGCSGSTSGGIKIIRFMELKQNSYQALRELTHPNQVLPTKVSLHSSVAQSIRGFTLVYILIYILFIVAFTMLGYSLHTAFSAVTACLSGVGVTIGSLAHGYHGLSSAAKTLLTIIMLTGRLEVMAVIALFMPSFWME